MDNGRKYKVGDTVRVRLDLEPDRSYIDEFGNYINVNTKMVDEYAGGIYRIQATDFRYGAIVYSLEGDNSGMNNGFGWMWTCEMLEDYDDNQNPPPDVTDLMSILL